MTYRAYTTEQARLAVESSKSIAGVCRALGIAPKGGNYGTIKRLIVGNDWDCSHFTGQGWNKGKVSASPKTNAGVKRLLLSQRPAICEGCQLDSWRGIPITLELEHVDGNRDNNANDNLQLLCPNCHSQTPTWRRKKTKPNPTVDVVE